MIGFQMRAKPPPTKASCTRILEKSKLTGCVVCNLDGFKADFAVFEYLDHFLSMAYS